MASMLDDLRRRYAASNQRYEDRTTMGGRGQLAGGMQDRTYRSGPEYLRGIQSLRKEASARPQVRGMTPEAVRHRGLVTPREPIPVSSVAGAGGGFNNWLNNFLVGAGGSPRSGTPLPTPISAARSTTPQPAALVEPPVVTSAAVGARPAPDPDVDNLRFHGGVPYEQTADDVRGHFGPVTENRIGARARTGALPRVLRPFGSASDYPRPVSAAAYKPEPHNLGRAPEGYRRSFIDTRPDATRPIPGSSDDTGAFNKNDMLAAAESQEITDAEAANARSARMAPPVLYEGENMEGMVIEGGVPSPAAAVTAVTAAEAEPVQEPVDERSFLDNEWVRLGLNMMVAASKPGATALGSLGEGAMATISDRDKRKAINAEYAFRRNMLEAEQKHSSSEKTKDRAQTALRIDLLEKQRQDDVDRFAKTHALEGKKVYDSGLMSAARIKSIDDEKKFRIEAAEYAKINDVNDRNLKMVELVSKRNNAERTSLSRIATALAPGMKTWMESAAVRDPAYIKASAEGKREMAGAFLNGLVDQVTGQVGSTQRIIAKEGSRDLLMGFIMSQNPNLFDFKKGNGGGGQDSPMPDTDPLNVR